MLFQNLASSPPRVGSYIPFSWTCLSLGLIEYSINDTVISEDRTYKVIKIPPIFISWYFRNSELPRKMSGYFEAPMLVSGETLWRDSIDVGRDAQWVPAIPASSFWVFLAWVPDMWVGSSLENFSPNYCMRQNCIADTSSTMRDRNNININNNNNNVLWYLYGVCCIAVDNQ